MILINKHPFYLDVDFLWPWFLCSIESTAGASIDCIVITHKTIKQAAWLSLVSGILQRKSIFFIIVPTITLMRNRKETDVGINSLLMHHSPMTIKAFLMTALRWRRKEVTVESKLLHRISLCADMLEEEGSKWLLNFNSQKLSSVSGAVIPPIITKLNKKEELTKKEGLILACLK